MKTLKIIGMVAFIALATFTFSSCSKDAGMGGQAAINGKITYPGGEASKGFVSIAYDATDATTEFDQVVVADDQGNYRIEGLEKGDYFVDAEYWDAYGNHFTTAGCLVTIGEKKADVTVDMALD